ncbi:MAG: enoyl-CoA hydratase-related protein [Polyangiaceae bacterium]
MSDSQECLLVEQQGHIVTVTMNRPEARNAFNLEMLVRMADAWDRIDQDRGASRDPDGRRRPLLRGQRPEGNGRAASPERVDRPPEARARAALEGAAPLLSAEEAADRRGRGHGDRGRHGDLASHGHPHRRRRRQARGRRGALGAVSLGGSTVRLRRQIPFCHAMEMLFTGKHLTAEDAEKLGLINRVVPKGTALEEALKIAEVIAGNGPLAVQAMKRSVQETEGLTEAEALKKELEIGWPILATEDAKEGPRAFAEKRKPVFKGK